MKAVFCKVLKAPPQGSEVRICYKHRTRGGMTEAAVIVTREHFWRKAKPDEDTNGREIWNNQPEPDRPAELYVKMTDDESTAAIADSLSKVITEQWTGEMFCSKARNNEIVITTTVDDHVYFPLLNGVEPEGRDVIKIEE